jgi:hypothetical protein
MSDENLKKQIAVREWFRIRCSSMALNDEATVEKPHQYYTGANYLLVHWE